MRFDGGLMAFNLTFQVPNERYLLMPNWRSQLKMAFLNVVPERWSQGLVSRSYRRSLPIVSPTPLLGSIRSNSSTMSTVSSMNSRY